MDATVLDPVKKVRTIREAQLDVAIDLSGWTGNHFMRGFMARLAPLQVNYLGYFATTGLPTMDNWIGDDGLFPSPMQNGTPKRFTVSPVVSSLGSPASSSMKPMNQ